MLSGLAAACAAVAWWWPQHRALQAALSRTYRIGANRLPPYYFVHPDGHLDGLVVDVINEAARRSGVRIEWVIVDTYSIDAAMNSGRVDIWPGTPPTAARKVRFHLTSSWLNNSFSLIFKAESGIADPSLVGERSVAHGDAPFLAELARRYFPHAHRVPKDGRFEVAQAVCSGEVAAGLVESRFLDLILMRRPAGCEETAFRVDPVPGAVGEICMMANAQSALVAERLRSAISGITIDGTLSKYLERWSGFASPDTLLVYALKEAESRNTNYTYAIASMLLGGMILVWLILRERSAHRIARDAHAAAAKANHAKSEFLANMSHEVRTP